MTDDASLALIDELARAAAGLRDAMQTSDIAAIELANACLTQAIATVQSLGAWRPDSQLKARIEELLAELENSRVLACLMGDITAQAHVALATRLPDAQQPLYGRALRA